MAKKTICPVSRKDFLAHAKPLSIKIGEAARLGRARQFSTKSLGWYLNGKTTIEVNGIQVAVQIGLNVTVVGSKELPEDESRTPVAAESSSETLPNA